MKCAPIFDTSIRLQSALHIIYYKHVIIPSNLNHAIPINNNQFFGIDKRIEIETFLKTMGEQVMPS